MWEGWSKPAELASSRAPPSGDRVSQAIGGRAPSLSDRGAPGRPEPSAGSFTGQGSGSARRPPRASQNSSEDGAPQDAAALGRRSRKTDRAHALSERIMPQRSALALFVSISALLYLSTSISVLCVIALPHEALFMLVVKWPSPSARHILASTKQNNQCNLIAPVDVVPLIHEVPFVVAIPLDISSALQPAEWRA